MSEITELTVYELSEKLKAKEVSCEDVTKAYLEQIERIDPLVKSYLTVTKDIAIKQAKKAQEKIDSNNWQPFTGVPLGIKDVLCTKGVRTTCASKMLENFVPPYDATVIEKLKEQGAVFLGKLNMDEFAMGSSTENSAFFPTHNPWDLDRVPGGSSGGSAAAVSARLCAASLGSDTGGSIRQPASHCGVVGMKPTYGRVSRFGLVAFASSLDQVGPICRDIKDCAMLMNVISGHDPKDSTSVDFPVPDYLESLKEAESFIKGLKIGLPKEYFVSGLDKEVEESVKAAINKLSSLGAEIIEISLPHTEYAIATYYLIAPAEACSNLSRYDGVKYGFRAKEYQNLSEMYKKTRAQGFGPEVKRRIMIGTYALSAGYYDAYYKKASQVRTLIIKDFKDAFNKCDVIATPVTPTPAFKLGEKLDDPLQMYLSDIFTISVNLAGIPGLSMPCAISSKGLPIGIQFMSDYFKEDVLLKVGYMLEQNLALGRKIPKVLKD